MPPKAAQKEKATPSKATPSKATPAKPSSPSQPVAPKKPSPRKTKDVSSYMKIKGDDRGAQTPVNILVEGTAKQATLSDDGAYSHVVKLAASNQFSIVTTSMLTSGEYAGHQALILRPAKPFRFLDLHPETRKRIYAFYFAPKGIVDGEISLEAKSRTSGEIYAKAYAEGTPHRVGVLGVNREVHDEAVPVLYAHTLRLESTTTLLDFLSQSTRTMRPRLRNLAVKNWVKTSARNALHNLAESPYIKRLHFDLSVAKTDDPAKAAKDFYAEAYKFLEAVGAAMGEKGAGVEVLGFGKGAFKFKEEAEGGKESVWDEDMVEEFRGCLRGKLV